MRTITFKNPPIISATCTVSGKMEGERLGNHFDKVLTDAKQNKKCWEQAESALQQQTVQLLLDKTNKKQEDIDLIISGDLLNQCTGAHYGLRDFNIPFYGIFGACATMAESLSLAALITSSGYYNNIIAGTSSHFYSAERQFRQPIEYGGQRAPTAQWTATGCGMALVTSASQNKLEKSKTNNDSLIRITSITPGRIIDKGITDANNMGAAMAPAAIDTIVQHLNETGRDAEYYDMILTGDLGLLGRKIVTDDLKKQGIPTKTYDDCGCMLFDFQKQDVHCGASGCGCSALVICGYILDLMRQGKINRVLFVGTGALLSPTSVLQGESIPCIAHAIVIEKD
ncbi:MAG: stage V sporulation protein AD [Clostridiales bacterium]|jgi:stage V sporulation protein AD|nr:stage V sporulation protein AD [Clostridiales bacterium]